MTFGELKEILTSYKNIKIRLAQIKNNDDLSRNQKRELLKPLKNEKKLIEATLNEYESVFRVSATVFEEELKKALSKLGYNKDAIELQVKEKMVENSYECFEGHSSIYFYDTRLDLVIDGKTEDVLLTWNREKSLTIDELMLKLAINILPIIKNVNSKYYEAIYEASINTIKASLNKKLEEETEKNNIQKRSLIGRLAVLKNPDKRQEEIDKLETRIKHLDNANKNITHDDLEVK